jgi:hypothetical protein
MVQSVDAAEGNAVISIVNRRGEVTAVPIGDIEAAKVWPQPG